MPLLHTALENLPFLLAAVAVGLLVPYVLRQRQLAKFPLLNTSVDEYIQNARSLIERGKKLNRPFRLTTDEEVQLYLPPSYAEYIKDDPRLSFNDATARSFPANLSGFEPFANDPNQRRMTVDVVQKKLTGNVGLLTDVLSNEMTLAMRDQWTDQRDFHQIDLRQTTLKMVARLSSRVFVGDELAHDEDWLRLTITYTVDSFMAAKQIRKYPKWYRPVAQWFLPTCQGVRSSMAEAKQLLQPVLEQRQRERAKTGGRADHFDAIEWFNDVRAGRDFNPVSAQVGLALAAIHTTTDLLTKSVHQIASHPEVLADVRREISEVIQTYGWGKTGMYQMKLLDSIIKETQRLDSGAMVSMGRWSVGTVQLPTGEVIPKGIRTSVLATDMHEERVHKNADTWDPYRFYNMRKNGLESKAQLVSVTKDHLAFGYGVHACPGRFFAAHEIKIALAHILMKYDLRYVEGDKPKHMSYGVEVMADQTARLEVRRRREEAVI